MMRTQDVLNKAGSAPGLCRHDDTEATGTGRLVCRRCGRYMDFMGDENQPSADRETAPTLEPCGAFIAKKSMVCGKCNARLLVEANKRVPKRYTCGGCGFVSDRS